MGAFLVPHSIHYRRPPTPVQARSPPEGYAALTRGAAEPSAIHIGYQACCDCVSMPRLRREFLEKRATMEGDKMAVPRCREV